MNISELLEGRAVCRCGKSHICPIDSVVIGKGVCESLKELCKEYNDILLVADVNTFAVGGDKVVGMLGEKIGGRVIFETAKASAPAACRTSAVLVAE